MTAPKTARKPRTRKPPAALAVRSPWIDGLAADFLILSSRLAETPVPVFWADGELDARTTLAVSEGCDYGDNYRRVLDDPWWDWNWYRDALLADEITAVPVVTLTVVPDLPVIMPGTVLDDDPVLTARVDAVMGKAAQQGLIDVPGPDEGAVDPRTAPSTAPPPSGASESGPDTLQDASAPGEAGDDGI